MIDQINIRQRTRMKDTAPKLENVVVVRAGRKSLHREWRIGEAQFDLIVVAYESFEDEEAQNDSCLFLYPGNKVAGLAKFFRDKWDLISQYKAVAIIDDDISCSADELNRCFAMGRAHHLQIWQPSLSWDSYFSHAVTVNNPIFRLRYSNFVEMMCPFFSIEYLAHALPTFEFGLESGIDQIWPQLEGGKLGSFAVLDAVIVRHTRKVGIFRHAQGFTGKLSEYNEYLKMARNVFGYEFNGIVAFGGILKSGVTIRSRLVMAILSVGPLAGYPWSVNRGWYIRPILNHCARNFVSRIPKKPLKVADLESRAALWMSLSKS